MENSNVAKIKETILKIYRSCRLCGAGGGYRMPIIQNIVQPDVNEIELRCKIKDCVQIEVHPNDSMPPLICELCVDKVNDFHQFMQRCQKTNAKTRKRLGLPAQKATTPLSDDSAENEPLSLQKLKVKKESSKKDHINKESSKSMHETDSKNNKRDNERKEDVKNTSRKLRMTGSVTPIRGSRFKINDTNVKPKTGSSHEKRLTKELQRLLDDSKSFNKEPLKRTSKDHLKGEPPSKKARSTQEQNTTPKSSAKSVKDGPTSTKISPAARIGPASYKTGPASSKSETASKTGSSAKVGPASSKTRPASSKIDAVSSKVGPASSKVGPASSKVGPASSKVGPASSKVGPDSSKVGPASSKAGPASSKAGPASSKSEPDSSKSRLKIFTCFCGGIIKGKGLYAHYKSHRVGFTPENLACNACQEWFASAEEAAAHHRQHYTRMYSCRRCHGQYKLLASYQTHTCIELAEVPDVKCAKCWAEFPTTTLLDMHKCAGLWGRPGGPCQYCDKVMKSARTLKKHEKSCTQRVTDHPAAIDPEVKASLLPMEVRLIKCDTLLRSSDGLYDVTRLKPDFALDPRRVYPYLTPTTVKPEPSDFIGMVKIPDKSPKDIADINRQWETDSESDNDTDSICSVDKTVPSLTKLTLNTMFPEAPIKVPKKRRKSMSNNVYFNIGQLIDSIIDDNGYDSDSILHNRVGNDNDVCDFDMTDDMGSKNNDDDDDLDSKIDNNSSRKDDIDENMDAIVDHEDGGRRIDDSVMDCDNIKDSNEDFESEIKNENNGSKDEANEDVDDKIEDPGNRSDNDDTEDDNFKIDSDSVLRCKNINDLNEDFNSEMKDKDHSCSKEGEDETGNKNDTDVNEDLDSKDDDGDLGGKTVDDSNKHLDIEMKDESYFSSKANETNKDLEESGSNSDNQVIEKFEDDVFGASNKDSIKDFNSKMNEGGDDFSSRNQENKAREESDSDLKDEIKCSENSNNNIILGNVQNYAESAETNNASSNFENSVKTANANSENSEDDIENSSSKKIEEIADDKANNGLRVTGTTEHKSVDKDLPNHEIKNNYDSDSKDHDDNENGENIKDSTDLTLNTEVNDLDSSRETNRLTQNDDDEELNIASNTEHNTPDLVHMETVENSIDYRIDSDNSSKDNQFANNVEKDDENIENCVNSEEDISKEDILNNKAAEEVVNKILDLNREENTRQLEAKSNITVNEVTDNSEDLSKNEIYSTIDSEDSNSKLKTLGNNFDYDDAKETANDACTNLSKTIDISKEDNENIAFHDNINGKEKSSDNLDLDEVSDTEMDDKTLMDAIDAQIGDNDEKDAEKITLDDLVQKKVDNLNSMELDSISDDEFTFDT